MLINMPRALRFSSIKYTPAKAKALKFLLIKRKHPPISTMTRSQLISELRKYRNAWQTATTRHQDLDDVRLKTETVAELRSLLKWFYTDRSREQAQEWMDKYTRKRSYTRSHGNHKRTRSRKKKSRSRSRSR